MAVDLYVVASGNRATTARKLIVIYATNIQNGGTFMTCGKPSNQAQGWKTHMFFPMRSCEWLDWVKCELREDPKSSANRKNSQSPLRVKTEINMIFIKCLCGHGCLQHRSSGGEGDKTCPFETWCLGTFSVLCLQQILPKLPPSFHTLFPGIWEP